MLCVGLQLVIVVFSDHTNLYFDMREIEKERTRVVMLIVLLLLLTGRVLASLPISAILLHFLVISKRKGV